MGALKRLQKIQRDSPQVKYNIGLMEADFDITTIPQLNGLSIYQLLIPFTSYKYLYVPDSVCDMRFLLKTGQIIPIIFNSFLPTDLIKTIIVIKPLTIGSGKTMYLQFILSDITDIAIIDTYNERFTLATGITKNIEFPFPTYNIRLGIDVVNANWDFTLSIYPYEDLSNTLKLDNETGITENLLNNYYIYDEVGGSGVVTDPQIPFPSSKTSLYVKNNHGSTATYNVLLKSWLGKVK